ncbi:AT7L2 protein, partial [Urocolius indicus]|nr:AT7L2 protein [Urocolius indicus]
PSGAGLELEESGKSSGKKLDAMTLIKEDMNIFGHCPAHDEFYLVVCNHCSQVVKPQAFQKHCERRHGPLSKLYARAAAAAAKCHVAVNGQPAAGGTPKALREKPPAARGRGQPLPERPDKDNNLSKEPLGRPASAAVPKEPPASAAAGGDLAMSANGLGCQPESAPAPGDKDMGASKPPPRSHKKLPRKECDLNRQCGVLNPDTKKICTRLLTCKIHSVHQRREVQGRAKDFDVLVAELKANSRKERSPPGKDSLPSPQQDPSSLLQPLTSAPSTSPCRAKPPHSLCPLPRTRLSSDSDPEDTPAAPSSEGGATGVFPFPLPKEGNRVSSEESEEEGGEEPPRPPTHLPRPQAFCTFGSRLVSPGCYVFNRRLDRFCSALGSMLERHLSSHMWRWVGRMKQVKEVFLGGVSSYPSPPKSGRMKQVKEGILGRGSPIFPPPELGRILSYPLGSPHAAAACSQPECAGGGSQSITSPLPANTPSPSFSKLPSSKGSKASRAREGAGGTDLDHRKRKPPLSTAPPYKRTCV